MAGEKIKILLTDPLAREGMDILKKHGFRVDTAFGLDEKALVSRIQGYDALIVRSGTTVTADIINASDRLKVIGRAGVGLDNVDVETASSKGIIVMNAPSGNTISTAEHAFSLLLALTRNIPRAYNSLRAGRWERKKFMGVELYGKTLGVIGMGRIGTEFARRAQSFEMRVVTFDPFISREKARSLKVEPVDMDTLLETSDFITIHTPLIPETRHLLDEKAFKKMKKGVRIVNAARGGIIDESALQKHISSGKVAGAALDVFESSRKPPADCALLASEKVIATPHLGSSTAEAQLNVAIDIAGTVSDALLGSGYRNAANIPALEEEALKAAAPYVNLAERLGCIQVQLIDEPIKTIKVEYIGDIAETDTRVVTRALMKGVFDPILEENVNYVNSVLIARERGIRIVEKRTSGITDFANLISVEFETTLRKYSILGTLFSNKEPRIIKMDRFHVEAVPDGYMLVVENNDVPGIVGKIGTALGKKGINIAEMSFGRDTGTGNAISLLNVDSEVPAGVIAGLKRVEDINGVKKVKVPS
ncbi:MAG: phosphoglycerate dehydrogenase [Candidatus Omnitrophica bacterium]|nr:phosphoglycerate dehydrogenase [Candidatus Omnitrophota bacterium]